MFKFRAQKTLVRLENYKEKVKSYSLVCNFIKQSHARYYSNKPIVNGDTYLHLLNNSFLLMIRKLPQNMIFQQDRAPPPHIRELRALLDAQVSNFCIGRCDPTNWLAWSRDLMPCDLLFREYAKDKVQRTHFPNLILLNRKITSTVQGNSKKILQNISTNPNEGLNAIISKNGDMLKHCNISRNFNS